MRTSTLNPELQIMLSRTCPEVNQKAIQAELKAIYIRKSYRVGLSLDEYCRRFGIQKVWEVQCGVGTEQGPS